MSARGQKAAESAPFNCSRVKLALRVSSVFGRVSKNFDRAQELVSDTQCVTSTKEEELCAAVIYFRLG